MLVLEPSAPVPTAMIPGLATACSSAGCPAAADADQSQTDSHRVGEERDGSYFAIT